MVRWYGEPSDSSTSAAPLSVLSVLDGLIQIFWALVLVAFEHHHTSVKRYFLSAMDNHLRSLRMSKPCEYLFHPSIMHPPLL